MSASEQDVGAERVHPTYQEMIGRLQAFWARQGCVVMQPYHTEVGAGTFNPATLLRSLGPEPWRVAYVEPSIRPTDGRYGENPFRLQHYFQYQVLLKPSPRRRPGPLPRTRCARSGSRPEEHDIRFVEDDWEGPTLGAWGLGWEVWMDGMEITQFTYFQQAGGIDLTPISVELTYGLERIAMYLQDVDSVGRTTSSGARRSDHLRRRLPRNERAVEPLQLRGRRHRRALPALRRARGASACAASRTGCGAAGLRPGAQVQPRLQPARRARRDQRHRARPTSGAYARWRARSRGCTSRSRRRPRRGARAAGRAQRAARHERLTCSSRSAARSCPRSCESVLRQLEGGARGLVDDPAPRPACCRGTSVPTTCACSSRRAGSPSWCAACPTVRRPRRSARAARAAGAPSAPTARRPRPPRASPAAAGSRSPTSGRETVDGVEFVFAEVEAPRAETLAVLPGLVAKLVAGIRCRKGCAGGAPEGTGLRFSRPGPLDRRQARRPHGSRRPSRPARRRHQPGAPLPRAPAVIIDEARHYDETPRGAVRHRRATTSAGGASSPASTPPRRRPAGSGATPAASSRRSCSWSSGRASSPAASTSATCACRATSS